MPAKHYLGRILLLMTFLFWGCSGIKMISAPNTSDLYTEKFLITVAGIKEQYKQGNSELALTSLKKIEEQTLLPSEKALRRNLMGVIYFFKNQYEQAIYNFDLALGTSSLDHSLSAQIKLNLSSSYYKMGLIEKSSVILEGLDFQRLNAFEEKKYHLLNYKVSLELSKTKQALYSLAYYLKDEKSLEDLRNGKYFQQLREGLLKFEKSEKLRFFEDFEKKEILAIGYLGYLEVERLFYQGEKDSAKDLLGWIEDRFGNNAELKKLIDEFLFRRENYAVMDPYTIGVILPLSGDKKDFGQRALLGIDHALREIKSNNPEAQSFKLIVKDSRGSGAEGAFWVRELLEKFHAGAIIGGLFSEEGTMEYREAKKGGVLFVSLDQIYVSKEDKDHLLIEIPGSVESQINELFGQRLISYFGKKAAIIYPKDERGRAYVDEFWRKSKLTDVQVTDALPFELDQTDYRGPIKNLLGLKFKRMRNEELEVLTDIHNYEKTTSVRRVQNLGPEIDFDWVFIPAFPNEALQIIPSFNYFDAFNIKIIGGPSWRSQALSRESYKLGKLHFVGDDLEQAFTEFTKGFTELYKKRPKLIEMRSYDAFKIVMSLMNQFPSKVRDEFEFGLRSKKVIVGITGSWKLEDKIWLKELVSLELNKGKLSPLLNQPNLNSEI